MHTDPTPLPNIRRIAVLRANALGDFCFALPALHALRAAYPEAEITLLGLPWHAAFLPRPGVPVDRVVVVPHWRGVREERTVADDPAAQDAFFAKMREDRFDLAVQIHGGGRNSNPFLLRLGAHTTVGLRTPDAPALDRWIPYIFYHTEVLRYLEVVALVGAKTDQIVPRISVTEEDRVASRRIVPDDGRPLVALHPGASDPRRWWPAHKFAAVGDALAEAGARIVITGTPAERPQVEAVREGMRHSAQPLCGTLSLQGLTGLLARCAVVVTNDTGPLHLAAAVGSATVGIYWCSNMINAAPMTRAQHRQALSWRTTCPVCGTPLMQRDYAQPSCDHQASWVAEVPVDEVLGYALELLDDAPCTMHHAPLCKDDLV